MNISKKISLAALNVVGTPGPDWWMGSNEDDRYAGVAGNDTAFGAGGDDFLAGNGDNDALYGGAGDDILDGGSGNDVLDGGEGADRLIGGQGDDTYYIRNSESFIAEDVDAGSGYDTAFIFSPSYDLPQNVGIEVLRVGEGTGIGHRISGNGLSNLIVGGAGNDTLSGGGGGDTLEGGAGDDILYVNSSADVLIGGTGIDTAYTSLNFSLENFATIENLTGVGSRGLNLTGNRLSNIIIGTDDHDQISGGGGADILQGSLGNDTYLVDGDDRILDTGGIDTAITSGDYTLSLDSGVERLVAADGLSKMTLKGNAGDNVIIGNQGANTIYGGDGADVLTGGGGKDVFVLNTKVLKSKNKNIDLIEDYDVKKDSIWIENGIFKSLGKKGSLKKPAQLSKSAFWSGTKAHDADDRLIYNKKTGALYYDQDGSGKAQKILIAVLDEKLKMTHKEFFVV